MKDLKNLEHSGLVSIRLTGAPGHSIEASIDEAIVVALKLNCNVIIECNGEDVEINPRKIREFVKPVID